MKLITLKGWDLHVEEEAWGISAFKELLDRDPDPEKQLAIKEMLFVYFWCNVKSDFSNIPENKREESIRPEIDLPEDWVMDEKIKAAIEVYKKYSTTTIQRLYLQSLKSAQDIGDYLENTEALLAERDDRGKPVVDIGKITGALDKIPKIMSNLKDAYKQVVKEQDDIEGKKKGSQTMNMYEEGFKDL
jgi:hypothetical protein